MKGERFTPETAFHMETTLGLPHGFFDQPNPVLAPETIARLKSPLDFVQPDDEPEVVSETVKPASDPNSQPTTIIKDRLPEEPEMPKKATGGSPTVVQKSKKCGCAAWRSHRCKERTGKVQGFSKGEPTAIAGVE